MSANIKASTDGTQAVIGVGGVDQMTVNNAGVVTANSFVGMTIKIDNLQTYASNAAAIAGGLAANDVYKTATGELRIVV